METSFQYRGTLEETSIAEMFFTIFRHKVPGLIEISREGVEKQIYINDGTVINASSSDRSDSLGAYLYRNEKLTREQLIETNRMRAGSDKRHGEILIERGLLSPAELFESIRRQMEAIVWSVFSWQTGEVGFKIGEFSDPAMIKIHLPMRQVILRGIKHVKDAKALVARLGRKRTVLRPSYCTEELIEIALDSDEYRLLRLVNGKRSLYDVCVEGPFSVSENARMLYAFHVLQLIDKLDGSSDGLKIRLSTDAPTA